MVDQSVSLIADIPLAFSLLAAIVSAMLATRYGDSLLALSGLAAGLGAWTKNEGLALAIGFGAAVVILMRKRSLRWLVGVAPVLIASACFKLLLTRSDPLLGAASKIAHLTDPSRYGIILGGFWSAFLNMGDGLAHPAVALILVAIGLGFAFDTKAAPRVDRRCDGGLGSLRQRFRRLLDKSLRFAVACGHIDR